MAGFEKNMQLEECRVALYEFFKSKEYGSQVSWDEIEDVLGSKAEGLSKEQLHQILYAVNKMLFGDQKYLETIRGYGKKVLNPNEHSTSSRRQVKSAARRYRKAGDILARTNMNLLSEDEKHEVREDANKWRTLELFTNELARKKRLGTNKKPSVKDSNTILEMIELFRKE